MAPADDRVLGMRSFNTTGPCKPALHYVLPPMERAPTAIELIRGETYLAVSGPRQSGKTSLVGALVDTVNAEGWARAALLSCEPADQKYGVTTIDEAERALIPMWLEVLRHQLPDVDWPTWRMLQQESEAGFRLGISLARLARASDRPLVLVLDEVDCLARIPFGRLLRQVREGFVRRPGGFPHSIVLSGMRHLRDHDIAMGGDGSGSPFNIVEFITLGGFSREELVRLYAQHTADTGQRFDDAALDLVWSQTRGQPWLVNAIARLCVQELVPDRDQAIAPSHVEEAIHRIETRHPTHLASLAHRLAEERVLRVVAPVVVGDAPRVSSEDERYAVELGILERGPMDRLRPANPIYARALLRLFAEPERKALASLAPTWLVDGQIDLERLKENFLAYWARHRDMMKDRVSHPESVAHFGLMTYLDRVANGGGRVDREFAVGSGRLDLLLVHGTLKLPIEVKVHRDHGGDPVPQGLEQLDRYCAGLGVGDAWLVVFDQRTGATGTRLESEQVVTPGGRRVLVVRA